jgi:hypothetical protein
MNAPGIAQIGSGARARTARPTAEQAIAPKITGFRPSRSESRPLGSVAMATPIARTTTAAYCQVLRAAGSACPRDRSTYSRLRFTNTPTPARNARRTPVIRRNERSRSTSVPHASFATWIHERPRRSRPAGPSRTHRNVATARATSISPMSTSGSAHWLVAAPTSITAVPNSCPPSRITPMVPDATPTCCSGTRSGTYPWNGPWAMLELNWSPRKQTR